MVFYTLIILWLIIVLFLFLYLGHTPKGRAWIRILWQSSKIKKRVLIFICFFLAIVLMYVFHPQKKDDLINSRPIFEGYSQSIILELQEKGAFFIDDSCFLENPQPELAYILPTVLNVYNEIVKNPTLPRLIRLDELLVMQFEGYKQFKNRSINIVKELQKKLGPRYVVQIINGHINHELKIMYRGKLWDNEQLCSLPAMEASYKKNIDPALLMSIIRHTSSFDFNYRGSNREKGLLALDSGYGLEQIYIGAHKLKVALNSTQNNEDAVAMFYPIHTGESMNSEWRKSTLKKIWVKEVLDDIQFYKNNGLK